MEEQKSKNNVAHIVVLAVLFCAGAAVAMPSQDELDKIAPDVHELMGQYNDDLETGKMTHKDVGDKAVNLAMDAGDDEAANGMVKLKRMADGTEQTVPGGISPETIAWAESTIRLSAAWRKISVRWMQGTRSESIRSRRTFPAPTLGS